MEKIHIGENIKPTTIGILVCNSRFVLYVFKGQKQKRYLEYVTRHKMYRNVICDMRKRAVENYSFVYDSIKFLSIQNRPL